MIDDEPLRRTTLRLVHLAEGPDELGNILAAALLALASRSSELRADVLLRARSAVLERQVRHPGDLAASWTLGALEYLEYLYDDAGPVRRGRAGF